MNDSQIFSALFNGGAYALPYLIKFTADGQEPVYLVNNNENVTYNGSTYKASAFEYVPPDNQGNGGSLKVSAVENNLVAFVENADSTFKIEVTGVMTSGGEVQRLKQYVHSFGNVSYSENMELQFSLKNDDRLSMAFPPYKFDSDNNRGNT